MPRLALVLFTATVVTALLCVSLHLTLTPLPASPDLEGARLPTSYRLTPTLAFDRTIKERFVPFHVGGDVTEPVLLVQSIPKAPYHHYRSLSVSFLFEVLIDSNGSVSSIHTLKRPGHFSASPTFEASARQAISQWHYSPATLYGSPVPVFLLVSIAFTFEGRRTS